MAHLQKSTVAQDASQVIRLHWHLYDTVPGNGEAVSGARNYPSTKLRPKEPAIGGDTNVMGVCPGERTLVTAAIAMICRWIDNPRQYADVANEIQDRLLEPATSITGREVDIGVNPAREKRLYYQTATGFSRENGDDGAVGRGNRVNNPITPNRPMSVEAVAGKNPLTHPGKAYLVLAFELLHRIVSTHLDTIHEVTVRLVSQIGQPIEILS